MAEHYRTLSAVFPVFLRQEGSSRQVLLHRRQNTGYQDGKWDFAASGHVDEGETARMAVARECMEELGVTVAVEDVDFLHLCHRVATGEGVERTYYDMYFAVRAYSGTPSVQEPDKNGGLAWFSLDALPEDMIPARRAALQAWSDGVAYSDSI